MPKKKIETLEEVEVEEVEVEEYIPESEAKKDFRELIEIYKAQNPVKYAQKKEALEKKLNAMQ